MIPERPVNPNTIQMGLLLEPTARIGDNVKATLPMMSPGKPDGTGLAVGGRARLPMSLFRLPFMAGAIADTTIPVICNKSAVAHRTNVFRNGSVDLFHSGFISLACNRCGQPSVNICGDEYALLLS